MNYGWTPTGGKKLELEPRDEADRYCIQLYERVVSAVKIEGRRVLEVGCGRGGGASYLARYHRPAEIIAVDYSSAAIALCQQRHGRVPNLSFQTGDAERLPFAGESFDAVVNVESSHCYGQIDQFFREVARVLRPGGYFLFADAREVNGFPELERRLTAQTDWRFVESENITSGVTAALALDATRKRRLISEIMPSRRQKVCEEFAALDGTAMYEGFHAGRLRYQRWVFRRLPI
jgi:ubiquinone/menaquinone biosynthesis C-methylase UbiE